MDAETWGGETATIRCPVCGELVFKGRTRSPTTVLTPCRHLIVRSEGYHIVQEIVEVMDEAGV